MFVRSAENAEVLYCVAAAAQDEQPVSKPGTRTVIPLSGRVSCFIYFIGSPGKHSQSFICPRPNPYSDVVLVSNL